MEKKEQEEKQKEGFDRCFKKTVDPAERFVDGNRNRRAALILIGEDHDDSTSTAAKVEGNGELLAFSLARNMRESTVFLKIMTDAFSFYGRLEERDQDKEQEDSEEGEG